jgi:mannose-1-phosphate guanylyltransferase
VQCDTCVLLDSDNNIIISQDSGHLVSTIGLSDSIVIHTRDATLICPKSEAQRVKELVGKVRDKFGDRFQ